MMRKKIVSLCMALALCLGLLPVTAEAAAEGAPSSLYVGNYQITNSDTPTYLKAGSTQGSLEEGSETDWTVKYDPSTATLTLSGATIKGGSDVVSIPYGSGIYAQGSSNQPVTLTIELIGENTITGTFGIYVNAEINASSYGTNATLTIMGDNNGSLEVSGSNNGIYVKSGTGNASLNIKNVAVTSSTNDNYAAGVYVMSSNYATNSPNISLSVDGGSLTASGTGSRDGILFYVGSSQATGATTSLTVSNNAIVDARNGGISALKISETLPTPTPTGENSSGIVFDGSTGTVYGSVTLQEDLTIGEGESLTLDDGANLDAGGHNMIVDGGTLDEGLAESLDDSVIYKVTKVELNKTSLTLNVGDEETLIPTITPDNATDKSVTWESSDTNIATVDTNGVVTAVAPGTATITVTTVDGGYKDTCPVTVTAAPVPVTGVSLNKDSLALGVGDSETLTATVKPEDATNKAVTWTSSNSTVATVDQNGVVTAVAPGTATITVTTVDGGFTAICTVTVRPDIPPANPNYRITVEATQGGTVTADPTAAKAGTTVTLTPVPDRGYQVGTVAVTDRFGDAVAVTEQADGTYTFTMPNGQVKVEVTFVESQPEPLPFTDVKEGDWFHDAVRYVYDNGLMDGVGDGQFAPNATTNRAMVVTILYRLAGEPDVSGDVAFTDVEPGLWYTDAVLWAAQKGIVNGISETEFAPAGDLTREQLATILYRYAQDQGYDVSASADLSGFPDAGDIQAYATQALSWAVAEGLLQGFEDDSLQPGGTATRAQIAAILMRFLAAAPTA